MGKSTRMWVAVLVGLSVGLAASVVTPKAGAFDIVQETLQCGEVVTTSVKLAGKVGPCDGDGLVVGKAGITIDLNGNVVQGKGNPDTVGILVDGYADVTIQNGDVTGFDKGLMLNQAYRATVQDVLVQNSGYNGITLVSSVDSKIRRNEVNLSGENGILVIDSAGTKLSKNVLTMNESAGILTSDSDDLRIRRNIAYQNEQVGLGVIDGAGHKLTRNTAKFNGFVNGVADGQGPGIWAPKGTPGKANSAKGNDDPKQCLPKALCA